MKWNSGKKKLIPSLEKTDCVYVQRDDIERGESESSSDYNKGGWLHSISDNCIYFIQYNNTMGRNGPTRVVFH